MRHEGRDREGNGTTISTQIQPTIDEGGSQISAPLRKEKSIGEGGNNIIIYR